MNTFKEFKNYITERTAECVECPFYNSENDKCYFYCNKIDIMNYLMNFSSSYISTITQIWIGNEKNRIEKFLEVLNIIYEDFKKENLSVLKIKDEEEKNERM